MRYVIQGLIVVTVLGTGKFTYTLAKNTLEDSDKKIHLDAFIELSKNIKHLSIEKEYKVAIYPQRTQDIIAVIDEELTKKNSTLNRIAIKVNQEKKYTYLKPKKIANKEYKEINNTELIKLSGYNLNAPKVVKLSELNTELNLDVKNTIAQTDSVQDEVKNIQSGLKLNENEVLSNEIESDPVMYEYSNAKPETKSENASVISETVKKVIERTLQDSGRSSPRKSVVSNLVIKNEVQKEVQEEVQEEPVSEELVFDYTNDKKSASTRDVDWNPETSSAFSSRQIVIKSELAGVALDLKNNKIRKMMNFEFVPDYDRSERLDDQGTGLVTFEYSSGSVQNTIPGVIYSKDMTPVRVELDANYKTDYIALSQDEYSELLVSKNLENGNNSSVLINLGDVENVLKDVEIDKEYGKKIYWTKNFKETDSIKNAQYVLFLSISSGNVMISYLLQNNEIAKKIAFTGEAEIFYDKANINNAERAMYSLLSRTLMGKGTKELNIRGEAIGFSGEKKHSKKRTLNTHEILVPSLPQGMKKYLEINDGYKLIVGTSDSLELEIPSPDFKRKILDVNDLENLEEKCVLQINLPKKSLRNYIVGGKSETGDMFLETSVLDSDGVFYREGTEQAEKIFVIGEREGQFGAKIEYSDGTSNYIKSYCSEGTYLVEHI